MYSGNRSQIYANFPVVFKTEPRLVFHYLVKLRCREVRAVHYDFCVHYDNMMVSARGFMLVLVILTALL